MAEISSHEDLEAGRLNPSGKEYHFEDFKNSEQYFAELLEQMLPAIQNHEYSAIIGDDSSGRVPALVLRKFIAESYRRDGFEAPAATFYAAGHVKSSRGRRDDYLSEKVYKDIAEDFKVRRKNGGKALIVTEYIDRGKTMNAFIGAIRDAGVECDVATLAMPNGLDEYNSAHQDLSNLANTKVYSGGIIDPHLEIPFFSETKISGVKKEYDSGSIHALPIRKHSSQQTSYGTRIRNEDIVNSRKDADHLAQKLIEKFLPPK